MSAEDVAKNLNHLRYLDVKQVAELLGVHPRTVWRLVSTGDLPKPVKISTKIVRWRLSELQDHLESYTG